VQINNHIPAGTLNYISKRQSKSLGFFWLGYIVYILAYTVTATTHTSSLIAACQGVQIIGIGLFIAGLLGFVNFKFDNQYLGFLFTIFYAWQFIVIIRGFQFNVNFIKLNLFDPGFGIFSYLIPIVLLAPRNLVFYKKLFNIIIISNIFYLIFDGLFIKILLNPDRKDLLSQGAIETFAGFLAIQAGFILLTYIYHSAKRQIFALAIMLITVLFAIYRARRGLIFICVSTLICYFLIYLITTRKKLLIIYCSVFFAIILLLYINGMYKQSGEGLFGHLMERGSEDTRSGVEDFMIADMTDTDWMIGKGLSGEYYCPNIDENDITGYRSVIESGYLEMLLKGGSITLVSYLLIAIPAIFLGLFYSRNILSKASALWILLSTLYIYPIVVTSFDMRYMIYWIGIGICYSRKIRSIPDNILKEYFQEKDKIYKELFF
jgi:hypothetical protein